MSTANIINAFGWNIPDKPGQYTLLPKNQIGIDYDCQREKINTGRVSRIANQFHWYMFGVLTVFRRPDGSYWCADGQHRLLAARKLDSVHELPCLVFDANSRADEAKGFLAINGDRTSVNMVDKFHKLVTTGDETAILVQSMIAESGYRVGRGGTSQHIVGCIGSIYRAAQSDFASAEVAWKLCVEIFKGKPPLDRVYMGIFTLECEMRRRDCGSMANPRNAYPLIKAGPEAIAESIRKAHGFRGSEGPRISAEGVARIVNYKRRTGLVPNMAPTEEMTD